MYELLISYATPGFPEEIFKLGPVHNPEMCTEFGALWADSYPNDIVMLVETI